MRRAAGRRFFAMVVLATAALGARADAAAAQIDLPRPTGWVNDFANVIPADDEARIEAVIREVQAKSGGEIAVVTLPSLEGRSRDEVGLQVLREWGVGGSGEVGDSARNAGAVILVAPNDRDWKIELGYGTNAFLTAAEAGRIGRDQMVPFFRQQDFGEGIYRGVVAVAQEYAENYGFELTGVAPPPPAQPRGEREGGRSVWPIVLLFLFFFLMSRRGGGGGRGGRRRGGPVIIPFPMGGGGRGGWGGGGFGGGGFGGGFGGFGGGSGGGGGAGGSW